MTRVLTENTSWTIPKCIRTLPTLSEHFPTGESADLYINFRFPLSTEAVSETSYAQAVYIRYRRYVGYYKSYSRLRRFRSGGRYCGAMFDDFTNADVELLRKKLVSDGVRI